MRESMEHEGERAMLSLTSTISLSFSMDWAGPTLINSITNHQHKTNWIMTKSIHRQGHYFNQFSYYILLEHNGILVVHTYA